MEVQLVVEGIHDRLPLQRFANGDFAYDWVVPDIFDFGNHSFGR